MDNRYHRFLSRLDRLGLDGFVVSRLPNLAYLFDLPASAGLAFCLHGESTLIVDSRYLEQARSRFALFRNTSKERETREILFFITVRIK